MRRLTAVPLLAALALAGCSDDKEPPAGPSPSVTATPTPSALPTPTASPSATTAPTATTPPGGGPAPEGDVDGDGRQDDVTATATRLTVVLSGGGTVTAPVHADSPRAPQVLGSHDVDGDGHAEVFLLTASGASTQFASLYRYDGSTLSLVTLDGEDAQLGIGGTVTHGNGFRCAGSGLLEVRTATSDDGTTYAISSTSYRLAGATLARVRTTRTTARQGDPAVQASYTVDCGGVSDGS